MGLTVTFTDTSTPAASIVAWVWDFGDGTYDTVQNPVHTYAAGGTYSVTLYVFGAYGGQDHTTQPVTVTSYAWCKEYDFTAGASGWAAGSGTYVAGVGFVSAYSASSHAINASSPAFSGNTTVKYIEMRFERQTTTPAGENVDRLVSMKTDTGTFVAASKLETIDDIGGLNGTFTLTNAWSGSAGHLNYIIYLSVSDGLIQPPHDAIYTIVYAKVQGDGASPLGASNC